MPNVAQLIRDHVSLSNVCIDRLYINGFIPKLQSSGQLVYFLGEYLDNYMVSPVLLQRLRERFGRDMDRLVSKSGVPLVRFKRGERKDTIANDLRRDFGEDAGVVFVGVAQERMWSFKARKVAGKYGGTSFDFSRQSVHVNHYYFYVQDPEWGPAFLKVGSYVPYPVKLCLNGHEWVKRQLLKQNIGFESLDNGFLACDDPDRLQEICDELHALHVQDFFDRWSSVLPWPLLPQERSDGYNHRLSIWQCEVSQTQVFNRPIQGRHFFEQLIRDNIDLGRPDRVSLLFPTRHTKKTPAPPRGYRTRVITRGVAPSLHIDYRRSHVKQYFKEERALRTETTINDPNDFGVNKGLANLTHLRNLGQQVNRKLLELEQTSHHCALSQEALDRLQTPTTHNEQRASALRFGDSRTMALLHALCLFFHLPAGFRNAALRQRVVSLLGLNRDTYTAASMTYDLRRLRLKGLIFRIPGTNRYTVTTFGLQAALFYTKVHLRILRPGMAMLTGDDNQLPSPLRKAFEALDEQLRELCQQANLSRTDEKLDSNVKKAAHVGV